MNTPPRNWKRYWWAYIVLAVIVLVQIGVILGHCDGVSGALAAIGIVVGGFWRMLAIMGIVLELFYQFVEFLKYRDTPARDVKDIKIGYYVTIAVFLFLYWFIGPEEKSHATLPPEDTQT